MLSIIDVILIIPPLNRISPYSSSSACLPSGLFLRSHHSLLSPSMLILELEIVIVAVTTFIIPIP
jgi:hypothetical protein